MLHALQPHKELRFLVPVLPLFAALAGVGLDAVLSRTCRPRPRGSPWPLAVVAVAGVSGLRAGLLTFGDIGQYEDVTPRGERLGRLGPRQPAAHRRGPAPDVCGLKVEAAHLAWTGGYSYFHRDVPLYAHSGPGRESGLFSHVITLPGRGRRRGGGRRGPLVLVRLPVPGCVPDPGYLAPAVSQRFGPRGRSRRPALLSRAMSDCLFCKIRDGHIPAKVVHRDDSAWPSRTSIPRPPRTCSSSRSSTSPR